MNRILEVCAGSIESIRAAHQGGAQRIELCSALSEDGLSPSEGMLRCALAQEGLAVHVLIRPRAGDFVYSEAEVQSMVDDIRRCHELGVQGVVIGALTPQGNIDLPVCRRLIAEAKGMNITFHRAFDACRHPQQALEDIIALGCTHLLTSGQARTAEEGIPMLRQLVQQAAGRIIIMPGAGVNEKNAARILRQTGATQIHGSARSTRLFGRLETDPAIVAEIVTQLRAVDL